MVGLDKVTNNISNLTRINADTWTYSWSAVEHATSYGWRTFPLYSDVTNIVYTTSATITTFNPTTSYDNSIYMTTYYEPNSTYDNTTSNKLTVAADSITQLTTPEVVSTRSGISSYILT